MQEQLYEKWNDDVQEREHYEEYLYDNQGWHAEDCTYYDKHFNIYYRDYYSYDDCSMDVDAELYAFIYGINDEISWTGIL